MDRFKPYRYTSSYFREMKKVRKTPNSLIKSVNNKTPVIRIHSDLDNNNAQEELPIYASATSNYCTGADDNGSFDCNNSPEEDDQDRNEMETVCEKLSFLDDIKNWALMHKIPLSVTAGLLKILRAHGRDELPKDPTTIETSNMGAGKFWSNGIEISLINQLSSLESVPSAISLVINIDGMSPFNSSLYQFWPILILVEELRELPPMVAGIDYGEGKPPLKPYLFEFVNEIKELIARGFSINGKHVTVKIMCFVCDTQARSFIKGTPGSNAENGSCIKCTVTGEWNKRGHHMSYPRVHCPRRTDKSFRDKHDEDHHRENTPLTALPIDMIDDFVVADSLHLFDLGIMRCLYGWREGSYNFRTKLSKCQADLMSNMLQQCNKYRPTDVQRAIRNLKHLKFWKGSEFRIFLHYLGIVVLKDFLLQEVYEHFLMLSCAVTILSCREYLKYVEIAKRLLEEYIQTFIVIYGIDSVSSKVHNLCHVVDDVKRFGPLPQISSYPFENFLGTLKSLVRNGNLPLCQVAKRITEMSKLHCSTNKDKYSSVNAIFAKNKNTHQDNHELPNCKGVFKELFIHETFTLKVDKKNNYIMTKHKKIVIMQNATYCNDKLHIYGASIKNLYNFFNKPFASSHLNICAVKAEFSSTSNNNIYECPTENPKLYSLNDIKCKLFGLKYKKNEFVFFL